MDHDLCMSHLPGGILRFSCHEELLGDGNVLSYLRCTRFRNGVCQIGAMRDICRVLYLLIRLRQNAKRPAIAHVDLRPAQSRSGHKFRRASSTPNWQLYEGPNFPELSTISFYLDKVVGS